MWCQPEGNAESQLDRCTLTASVAGNGNDSKGFPKLHLCFFVIEGAAPRMGRGGATAREGLNDF